MNWNWLIHLGVASQILPAVAALHRRRWLDPARRAALAWALLLERAVQRNPEARRRRRG